MSEPLEVHIRVSLANEYDRCRDAVIMGEPSEPNDQVSLWVDSFGFGTRVEFTRGQAREIAAALIKAAGPVTT